MLFYLFFVISLFITVGIVLGTDLMHLVCFLCRLYMLLKEMWRNRRRSGNRKDEHWGQWKVEEIDTFLKIKLLSIFATGKVLVQNFILNSDLGLLCLGFLGVFFRLLICSFVFRNQFYLSIFFWFERTITSLGEEFFTNSSSHGEEDRTLKHRHRNLTCYRVFMRFLVSSSLFLLVNLVNL